MNPRFRNVLLFFSILTLGACAGTSPGGPTASAPPDTVKRGAAPAPADDLSKYRPVFTAPKAPASVATVPKTPVAPTSQVNAQIEQRLRDQAYTNQNVKYAQGFRILAYVGLERPEVMNIRRTVISRYPDETDYITFKQPIFRLYIGDYLTRLEAEQALLRIKPLVPKAELEPAQVVLNKTRF